MNQRQKQKQLKQANQMRLQRLFNRLARCLPLGSVQLLPLSYLGEVYPASLGLFKLKTLPEWQFGFWLVPETDQFHLLGDHVDLMTSFHPNTCYVNYPNLTVERLADAIQTLTDLAMNPLQAFVKAYTYGKTKPEAEAEALALYHAHCEERLVRSKREEPVRRAIFEFVQEWLNEQSGEVVAVGIYKRPRKVFAPQPEPRYEMRIQVKPSISEAGIEVIEQSWHYISQLDSFNSFSHQFTLGELVTTPHRLQQATTYVKKQKKT